LVAFFLQAIFLAFFLLAFLLAGLLVGLLLAGLLLGLLLVGLLVGLLLGLAAFALSPERVQWRVLRGRCIALAFTITRRRSRTSRGSDPASGTSRAE